MALVPLSNVAALLTTDLDTNFNILGSLVVIPCLASGVDTIALAPITGGPAVTVYNFISPVFGFNASGTTTSSPVTISVAGIGAKNVYKDNGATLIGAGDFVLNRQYYVAYNPFLNSSAGGWVVINPGATSSAAGSIKGTFSRLVNTWTSNTTITIAADALSVSDGASTFTSLLNVSETLDSALSGAGGLDTGVLAASQLYGIYVIYNPSTLDVSSIMSTSLSVPTLPSGYTQYARVGTAWTDGSKHFKGFVQRDHSFQYSVGSNLTGLPSLVSGVSGSVTVPTYTAVSMSAVVPTAVASKVKLVLQAASLPFDKDGAIVAPNAGYGAWDSTTNPPVMQTPTTQGVGSIVVSSTIIGEVVIESPNIYYASDSATTTLFCLGYDDPL